MWLKVEKPSYKDSDGKNYIVIDYRQIKSFAETDTYGNDKNPISIQKEIDRVKNLHIKNFEKFDYELPKKDELIIVNNTDSYQGICIIRKDGESHFYDYEAMVDNVEEIIILPFPLIARTPQQAINHEVGHWFFDRKGDELAEKYDYRHRTDIEITEEIPINDILTMPSIIASFDQSTEMAAYYCEETFNGKYDRSKHHDKCILRRIDNICKKNDKPLVGIYNELEEYIKKDKGL